MMTGSVTGNPPMDGSLNIPGAIEFDRFRNAVRSQFQSLRTSGSTLQMTGAIPWMFSAAGAFITVYFWQQSPYPVRLSDMWEPRASSDPGLQVIYNDAMEARSQIGWFDFNTGADAQWYDYWTGQFEQYTDKSIAGDFGPTAQGVTLNSVNKTVPAEFLDRLSKERVKVVSSVLTDNYMPCLEKACPPPVAGSKYRGGAHWCTSQPVGDGLESHHMPAQGYGNTFAPALGPAIQMEKDDHKMTASQTWAQAHLGKSYAKQAAALKAQQNVAAFKMDVGDVKEVEKRIMDIGKYAAAVMQARIYMNCLQQHGFVT